MKKITNRLIILNIISMIIISFNVVVRAETVDITNIHWLTNDKKNVLMWDKVKGTTMYSITCINTTTDTKKSVSTSGNNIDLTGFLLKVGKYKISITAYNGRDAISNTCWAPSIEIEKESYVIVCKVPSIKNQGSYTIQEIYYDDETETFELKNPEDIDHYTFNGWTGEGKKNQMTVTIPKGSTGDRTYTAEWTEKEYTISFDSQGGSTVSSKKYKYNSKLGILPSTTKDHYDFDGWYAYPKGGNKIGDSATVTGDRTYYAHWVPKKYSITAYVKNEDGSIGKRILDTTYTIESEKFELDTPTFTDGWFEGWVGDDIVKPVQNLIIPKGTTGDKRYYALFKKNPCSERHTPEKVIEKATPYKDGRVYYKCSICGKEVVDESDNDYDENESYTILHPNYIKILQTNFVYDGKQKYPNVRVGNKYAKDEEDYRDGESYMIEHIVDYEKGKDYTVTYKNNVEIGTGTVIINFKGNIEGQVTRNFDILPPPTSINNFYPESKKLTVLWKKGNSAITGYQIQYAINDDYSDAKTINIYNNRTTQVTIKGLKNLQFYNVRIRTYKKIGDSIKYSSWSKTVSMCPDIPRISHDKITLYRGEKQKIVLYNVLPNAKIKWKIKNKKIATISKNGKIKGKKLGTTIITAKYNGKIYKCKVKVGYQKPNFYATLFNYNTRNNYFTIIVKNNTKKKLTIKKGITKVEDFDYKNFDRRIKLSKSVTIKPKKEVKIKFKVIGKTTWYKYDDFSLYYRFKFDGKEYYANTEIFYSKYKSGKKWKNTYKNLNEYQNWHYEI